MRLAKLTIGSSKENDKHQFKNLKNVTIDFDQDHWVTVLIGWNGTGKSNVLEALAIIFRDLIAKKRTPAFAFQLAYRMGSGENIRYIHIDADPLRGKDSFRIYVADANQVNEHKSAHSIVDFGEEAGKTPPGKPIKLTVFLNADAEYLPRYVFSYYSGESSRMHEVFRPYLGTYDSKLRNGEDPGLKRLFYALPVHSQFVLLAFMIKQSSDVRDLLENNMGIDPDEGIESVLFVLKQPDWSRHRGKRADVAGDSRFWGSKGIVQTFLDRLQDIALAPIRIKRDKQITLWNKEKIEFQYLFIKDIDALKHLVGEQLPADFFRDLESTYVSELIEEVRIRVRLKKNDGSVTFQELSEGEQQLLTVLGLLRFTAGEESLFLLDEPDTHLNPRWSVDYTAHLKQFIAGGTKQEETSHILLTTHNPLAIAELDREQVQVLRMQKQDGHRQIVSCYPEVAPRGMGYAAIVTSDMFGIASSLDHSTQMLLEKQRAFAAKEKLTPEELHELDSINAQLDRLGFRFFHPDDEYSRYLRLRNELLVQQFKTEQPEELAKGVVQMLRIDREALAKRLIHELVKQRSPMDEAGQS